MRVATRPNPRIDIGPVDLSCAFCVCDLAQQDMPIVYCSESFETLTGYTEKEIIGRNCRFLQFPGGQENAKRSGQDDELLYHLKMNISRHQETQHSIINYRKDGTRFQNLVTMIPIAWDGPELRYYVGFQADARSAGSSYLV
jgi:PAS domain S-box-containing protein